MNSRYHFRLDDKPYTEDPLDDAKWPQSVAEAMLMRARYHGIIDYGVDDDAVMKHTEHRRDYQTNAQLLLDSLPDTTSNGDTIYRNLFGYLFAKAVEAEYSEKHKPEPCNDGLWIHYVPSDAWQGKIETLLDDEKQSKVEKAFELGKQFYQDYTFHMNANMDSDFQPSDAMMEALILVQTLGQLYSTKCLGLPKI